ncbi:MAG: hypothetical protein DRP08_06130 [Candidatus Aenigmatarchaeota archaeon]|nr:MAG: hypothetical protein DRP08_06130 [Candidatus Aenigmarchaeota archaeon]
MSPHDIQEKWEFILPSILQVLRGDRKEVIERIKEGFETGALQCWAFVKEGKVVGIMTTVIVEEPILKTLRLLVFSVAGFDLDLKELNGGFEALVDFAKENGCEAICAYTHDKRFTSFLIRAGGGFEYFVFFRIGDEKDEDIHKDRLFNEDSGGSGGGEL